MGKQNSPVTVGGEGEEREGRVGAARKKGWGAGGGNNRRNFNFSNFTEKPTGDGVVGGGGGAQDLIPPSPVPKG